jgi:ADP-L-glycero-D-manno-heptose 6-epimerase
MLLVSGAGFIGSNLVAALTARGDRVIVCDRLGLDDKWRNIAKRPLEDLIAPEALDDCLGDCAGELDAVIHMGAISATTERDADALAANNFGLSRRLWTWCSEKKVPLIYASSAATYGDGSEGFDDALDKGYQARLRPLNGYGWSKLLFDRWVAAHCGETATRPPFWAGLKFFNVYGPNEYHKRAQASVAYHLFQQIAGGEPARLFQSHNPDYPDGGQLRDFVWVGDCVAVVLWLLDTGSADGLFNVGTGKARSFADLARAIFETMDQAQNIQYVPTPEAIRARYQYFTEARMERLRGAGYEDPFTSLEAGVGRYLRDHLMTDDPYL